MFSSLASITLGIFCIVCQDASALQTIDKFHITRLTTIETTEGIEKSFLFPDTMSYQIHTGARGRRFTLKVTKHTMAKPPPVIQYHDAILFTSDHPVDHQVYNSHQVAFYKSFDEQTFLAEKCDAEKGTCFLAGTIYFDNKIWTIAQDDGNPSVYFATSSGEAILKIEDIINDAYGWKNGEGEPMPTLQQEEQHSISKRAIRHRRSVSTSCNILEVVAVADASVWQYFLARNNQNATAAMADEREHYDALFREVDLIYSTLPESLCLRVYLRDVLIQTNASTDWSTLTALGNVNITAGFDTCAQSLFAGADTPLCFTRTQMQFQNVVEGVEAASTIGVICSNETIEAGLFEDEHDGLPRLVSLIIALQINNVVLNCSNSDTVNNTFRVDDQRQTRPADTADFPITFTFSNCSVDFLTQAIAQLNNESNNCLLSGNLTDEEFFELANHRRLAGEIIDIHHQCQLAFGLDSAMCSLINFTTSTVIPNGEICGAGEFCTNNGTCGLNQTIVYSGTKCGTNQGRPKASMCGKGLTVFLIVDKMRVKAIIKIGLFLKGRSVGVGGRGQGSDWVGPTIEIDPRAGFDGKEPWYCENVNRGRRSLYRAVRAAPFTQLREQPSRICFKGECINNFTCGSPPSAPNGFYTLNPQADTSFLAEALLNCQTGFQTSTNITIKCTRDGWSAPAENCSVPTTTTTLPTTSQGQIAIG